MRMVSRRACMADAFLFGRMMPEHFRMAFAQLREGQVMAFGHADAQPVLLAGLMPLSDDPHAGALWLVADAGASVADRQMALREALRVWRALGAAAALPARVLVSISADPRQRGAALARLAGFSPTGELDVWGQPMWARDQGGMHEQDVCR